MKTVDCLVPGCTWHAEGKESAELVRRAAEHLRAVHDEADVRPRMVDAIKARVHDTSETMH
jgi:predicted small metal-binding protein